MRETPMLLASFKNMTTMEKPISKALLALKYSPVSSQVYNKEFTLSRELNSKRPQIAGFVKVGQSSHLNFL